MLKFVQKFISSSLPMCEGCDTGRAQALYQDTDSGQGRALCGSCSERENAEPCPTGILYAPTGILLPNYRRVNGVITYIAPANSNQKAAGR